MEKGKISAHIKYLQTIIALMPGNVYWKNREGVYQGCNNGIAELVGLSHPSEIIGKTLYDFFDKELADSIENNDKQVMQSGKEIYFEETGVDKTGKPAYYLTRKVPIYDDLGKVVGLLGISIDITERKVMEQELLKAKELAESASRAKSEFITNMSHDIRTPLNGILGFSQILEMQETDPEKKNNLHAIFVSAQRLTNLLNEIVEIANLEFNGLPVNYEIFSIREIVQEITQLMEVDVRLKKIHLTANISHNTPEKIKTDKLRIHRIILNLVGNAIKFTHQGGVTINIDTKTDINPPLIEIAVTDTGIGIPLSRQETIFERFTRIDASDRSPYKGTGLGLYIAKEFIENLKGNINISSKLNEGSTFTCKIPINLLTN